MLTSILAVIFVFGLIVLVHEFGHMLAAKACGVAVPDFAIGMGPSLVSRKWGSTRYHVCAFPIGGFVRIVGLEGHDSMEAKSSRIKDDEGNLVLEEAPPGTKVWQDISGWQKAFVLTAGPLMNFVLAAVVVLAMGFAGFPERMVMIGFIEPGSPAAEAGLMPGDLVQKVGTKQVSTGQQLSALIQANGEKELQIEYIRGDSTHSVNVLPRVMEDFNENRVSIGIVSSEQDYITPVISIVQPKTLGYDAGLKIGDRITHVNGVEVTTGFDVMTAMAFVDNQGNPVDIEGNPILESEADPFVLSVDRNGERLDFEFPGDTSALTLGVAYKPELSRLPFKDSIKRSLEDAKGMMGGMFMAIRMMFTKHGAKSVSGPVGIASIISQSAQSGWYTFLQIIMLININLGLLNLLPLPALDGGRLVFVGLSGIGIRISEKREALVHAVGMVMLLGLIGIVTFTDILAFF